MKNIYFVLSLVCFIIGITILSGIKTGDHLNLKYNSVPIQSYDEVMNQLHYAKIKLMAQSIIINDLLTTGKIDTSFTDKINDHISINKINDEQKIINDKQMVVNQILFTINGY